MRRARASWALGAALALLLAVPVVNATAAGCPATGQDWAAPGPFAVTQTSSGQGHTIFHPASRGCLHPVILWGNGTGSSPAAYAGLLRHLASHGFVVAAADTGYAGSGKEILAGLDYLTAQQVTPGSVLHGRLDLGRVGGAGHSQGGAGAIVAGADPRVDTVVPIQPGPFGEHREVGGPIFYLAGQVDLVVAPALLVYPRYRETGHVPAVYGELAGAGHATPTGNGGGYRGPITAWFRFHLFGDERARGLFFGPDCGYCDAAEWSRFERNAKAVVSDSRA